MVAVDVLGVVRTREQARVEAEKFVAGMPAIIAFGEFSLSSTSALERNDAHFNSLVEKQSDRYWTFVVSYSDQSFLVCVTGRGVVEKIEGLETEEEDVN